MQKIVETRQGIRDAEFTLEDPTEILASEAADHIISGWPSEHAFSELGFLEGCEFAGSARLSLGVNGIYAAVPIGIDPTLHKVLAPVQGLHDPLGRLAFQS